MRGDATFWASRASDYLRAYFYAAAIEDLDLTDVARWVTGTGSTDAENILNGVPQPGPQWAALAGSRMPGGRLDPPFLMALDEVTQICRTGYCREGHTASVTGRLAPATRMVAVLSRRDMSGGS
jgi:hypothetical protein